MVLLTTEKKKYNKKLTIEDVHEYCSREEVKFKFIGSKEDLRNSKSKLLFLCLKCQDEFSRDIGEIKRKNITQCQSCNRKDRGARQMKDAFKEVLSLCDEIGLKCLSTIYNGNNEDLEFECTDCFKPFLRRPVVLKKDKVTICRECSYKKTTSSLKYSHEEVYSIFQEDGCTLLSKDYKSNKQKLDYICECGEEATIALSNFLQGQRCKKCSIIKQANSHRTSYEDVKRIFEDEGCILVSTEFINSNSDIDYICTCGELSKTRLGRFINSTYKKCRKCSDKLNGERVKGEKHPFWNPNLTEEDRIRGRNDNRNSVWRTAVYERDNYTCQCCGDSSGGNLRAHHRDGYNWCEEKRYDVENGITLCDDHHKDFHGKYGYGNNTEQQIVDYLDKYSTIER